MLVYMGIGRNASIHGVLAGMLVYMGIGKYASIHGPTATRQS